MPTSFMAPELPTASTLRSVDAIARLAAAPERAALLLDVDGVLAPIVDRPEDAAVPETTRDDLRRLAGRYALVACITGRSSSEARRIVGVPELRYAGEHGLELDPAAAEDAAEVHRFVAATGWPDVELKPYSASLHFRRAADPEEARRRLAIIAAQANDDGLRTAFGRMVLDVLPAAAATKGTAVRRLLGEAGLSRALYAGDDTTDLDAFAALDSLELAVRVGVASPDGPAEIRERADIVVDSPTELAALLARL
jgi:trehalose 6-phosphate phosphatase